jgi:hypothetical protein
MFQIFMRRIVQLDPSYMKAACTTLPTEFRYPPLDFLHNLMHSLKTPLYPYIWQRCAMDMLEEDYLSERSGSSDESSPDEEVDEHEESEEEMDVVVPSDDEEDEVEETYEYEEVDENLDMYAYAEIDIYGEKDECEETERDVNVFLNAIDPRMCIMCTQDTGNTYINTICDSCIANMSPDRAFIHKHVLSIYECVVHIRRQWLCDYVTIEQDDTRSFFKFKFRKPGARTHLPNLKPIVDTIAKADSELLEQCLLSVFQCHLILISLSDLLKEIFLNDPASPVANIEEIYFEPRDEHENVGAHFTHRFTLKDGSRLAVNFTDRQLGWLQLHQDWEAYERERVEDVEMILPLGGERAHYREYKGYCLRDDLWRVKYCNLSEKMVGVYEKWKDTGEIDLD